jgi:curved DNA-binding protein CbpA
MEEALRRSRTQPLEPWLSDDPSGITPPTRTKDRVPVQDEPWQARDSAQVLPAENEAEDLPLLEADPEVSWAHAIPGDPLPSSSAQALAPELPVLTSAPAESSTRSAPPHGAPPDLTPVSTSAPWSEVEPSSKRDSSLWAIHPAPVSAPPPLRLGATTPKAGEEDLWRIVAFDKDEGAASLTASFEAALLQVDAHLEALVRSDVNQASVDFNEPPIEAIVEATIEPVAPLQLGTFSGDNPRPTGQTSWAEPSGDLDDWDFDEDDVAADPSNPDEAAKLRRQRLLRRAMENMGVLSARTPSMVSAAPPMSEPSVTVPPPPAAAIEAPKPDEARLAQQIEQRYADIQAKRDHFFVLGVPQDVSRDQVKSAFLSLAKVFHPDRLPLSIPHMSQKMTSVFEAIREAYEVLYDDARRKAYQQTLQTQQALPKQTAQTTAAIASSSPGARAAGRPDSSPDDLYKMGEVFFRKRDFTTASDHYERAYSLDPKPLYMSARAWAIYMDPARKAEMAKAKQMMADAVRADPNCDRAHYQLGVIARVEGDMDRAERHFREAVRANSKHLEANQELRLIEMRKKNPPKKGGFFR